VSIFVAVAATALILRLFACAKHPTFRQEVHVYPTHLRIDSLFFGVLLSYLHPFPRKRLASWLLRIHVAVVAIGAALLVPVMVWPIGRGAFPQTFGFNLPLRRFWLPAAGLALFLAAVLVAAARRGQASGGHRGLLDSIYLWHLTVGW
jgi:hypothetical protein